MMARVLLIEDGKNSDLCFEVQMLWRRVTRVPVAE